MAKSSKQPAPKLTINNAVKSDELAIKVFAKSGWPKTVKANIKLSSNFFVDFSG